MCVREREKERERERERERDAQYHHFILIRESLFSESGTS